MWAQLYIKMIFGNITLVRIDGHKKPHSLSVLDPLRLDLELTEMDMFVSDKMALYKKVIYGSMTHN